jgi:PilZ domain
MKAETDWEELSAEASRDRRREKRIPLVFPIEVSGFDKNGRFFSERTVTADVSESGCRFQLKTEVERGAVLAIRLASQHARRQLPERPLLFKVARVAEEKSCWTLGASKLQPESLWCIAFPPQKQQAPVA